MVNYNKWPCTFTVGNFYKGWFKPRIFKFLVLYILKMFKIPVYIFVKQILKEQQASNCISVRCFFLLFPYHFMFFAIILSGYCNCQEGKKGLDIYCPCMFQRSHMSIDVQTDWCHSYITAAQIGTQWCRPASCSFSFPLIQLDVSHCYGSPCTQNNSALTTLQSYF